jgi:hypothetical protein
VKSATIHDSDFVQQNAANIKTNKAEQLKRKIKMLLELQSRESLGLAEYIRQLQFEIEAILEREDLRWKQRAKLNWYLHGDQTT